MKKRWSWALGVIVIFVIGIWLWVIIPREPTINGQSLRSWIKDVSISDTPRHKAAWQSFENLSDPLPVCIALLEKQPNAWDRAYAAGYPKIVSKLPFRAARWFPFPFIDNEPLRWAALDRLAQIGPEASNAVPCLIRQLGRTNIATIGIVARTLGQIGSAAAPAAPVLTQLLMDKGVPIHSSSNTAPIRVGFPNEDEFAVRQLERTIVALGQIGVSDAVVVEGLVRTLANPNAAIRIAVAQTLLKLEGKPQRLLPILPQWLAEPGWDPHYRQEAARILMQIVEAERSSLTPIEACLSDQDIHVRIIAADALRKLDGRTNTLVRVLADWAKDNDESERLRAIDSIRDYVGKDALALSAMVDALKDGSHLVRGWAAIYLGKLGSVASNSVPALTEALKDEYLHVRDAAAKALERIEQAKESGPPR